MCEVVVVCSSYITALGLIRALGESGYKIECFCYGNETNYILGSKYIKSGHAFINCEEAVQYLVDNYPIKENKPVLFSIPDPPAYYIDLNKDVLEKKFILFNAGESGAVTYWMDKCNISNLATKHGLLIPWMIKLSKKDIVPTNLTYPVFVKGVVSTIGGKNDEGVCYSEVELKKKIETLVTEEFIVMQYIEKVKEINFFGLAIKDRVYIDYYDVRNRFSKDAYGHYNSFHRCQYDALHAKMVNMIKETNYQGLFDVEFLVDKQGEYYFVEVNFRVDGEIYKLAEGIDLPHCWCSLVNLPEAELPDRLPTKRETFVGITEMDDFKDSVLTGQINFFVWLWQFISADRRMLFNFRDPMPWVLKIGNHLKCRIFYFF